MRAIGLALFLLTGSAAPLAAQILPPRSVSTSRQFIIYGSDVALRGAVAEVAERAKANLLTLLQKRDEWKTPIVVNLQFRQANVPEIPRSELRFSQTGFGLKVQLDLTIEADVNAPAIERDLLRAIFLEMIYRKHSDIPAGAAYVEAPDWLLDGVQAMGSGPEKEALSQALTAAGAQKKVMSLEELLRQKPALLDSPARLLYRAYSFALLQLLINQPDGAARLSAFVENLARATNDPLADLKAQFPVLGSAEDLGAMWQRSVSTFAITGSYQLQNFAESRRQLESLLHFKLPGSEKETEFEDLVRLKLTREQKLGLRGVAQKFLLLAASANPVLRPVAAEYQQIAELLAKGKKNGLVARLVRLKDVRAKMAVRMENIDDYMNWFEATQAKTRSGEFIDYLKAAGAAGEPVPHRGDPLSVYMDAMEAQFAR